MTKRPAPRLPKDGTIHRGRVKSIAKNANCVYGVFVRIENYCDGLVPTKELSDHFVENISAEVKVNQVVFVLVQSSKIVLQTTKGKKNKFEVLLSMKSVDQKSGKLK